MFPKRDVNCGKQAVFFLIQIDCCHSAGKHWTETLIFIGAVPVTWQHTERPIRIDGAQLSWQWESVT